MGRLAYPFFVPLMLDRTSLPLPLGRGKMASRLFGECRGKVCSGCKQKRSGLAAGLFLLFSLASGAEDLERCAVGVPIWQAPPGLFALLEHRAFRRKAELAAENLDVRCHFVVRRTHHDVAVLASSYGFAQLADSKMLESRCSTVGWLAARVSPCHSPDT